MSSMSRLELPGRLFWVRFSESTSRCPYPYLLPNDLYSLHLWRDASPKRLILMDGRELKMISLSYNINMRSNLANT